MGSSASKKKPVPEPPKPPPTKDDNNNAETPGPLKISHQGGPPYQPFPEFPDYQRLHQGQQDYAASTYEVDNDADGVPLTFPTTVPKSQACPKDRMDTIDLHARMARPELGRNTMQLVEYLTSVARTEVERVWALFAWVSSRDRENILPSLQEESPAPETPLHYLSMVMTEAKTHAYSDLFSKLCSTAKIPHKKVLGKIRAGAKELGEVSTSNSYYFMVFVEKCWCFVNPHWGSCYVKRVRSPEDWQLVEGVAGTKSGLGTASVDLLGYQQEPYWFLTDPQVMAYTFLSSDPKEQLLARPITMDEFRLMARLYAPFFEMSFTSISPAKCKLDVEKEFTIEIGIDKKSENSPTFDYGIYKRADDPEAKQNHKNIKQFMFVDRKANTLRAKFEIPAIGVYKIEINAREKSYTGWVTLCDYLIDCTTPNFACKPNPVNPLHEWGPRPAASELGLQAENDQGGLLEAIKGLASVTFTMNLTQKVQFRYKLESQTKSNIDLTNYVRHFESDNRQTVIARTPRHGNYVLKVYAKREEETKYEVVSHYLVKSDRGVTDSTPFPDTPGGKIGSVQKHGDPLLVPITHKSALIEGTPGGYLEIRMREDLDLDVAPILTSSDKRNMSQNVYTYKEGKERVFLVRFPEVTWYSLVVRGTWQGSNNQMEDLYQYVIVADQLADNFVPFPARTSAWDDRYTILEPRDGQLQANMDYSFRFAVHDAEQVSLLVGGEKLSLSRAGEEEDGSSSSNIWHTRAQTGNAGDNIKVLVQRIGNDNEEEIASYKVMSKEEESVMQKNKKNSEYEAKRRQDELSRREEEEERQKATRAAAEAKRVQALEADFEKNKTAYRSRQKQLEEAELKKNPEKGQQFKEFQMRSEDNKKSNGIDELDMSKWKEIFDDISGKMIFEKLREAIRSRDKTRLEVALKEARDHNVPKDNEVLYRAERELEIALVKEDLRESMKDRDPEKISTQIQRIYNNGFYLARLQPEAAEAYQLLTRLRRIRDLRVSHLDMKSATISEMRRYSRPPSAVHHVMQAALLMFEEDEEATEDWRYCQQQITPTGAKSLVRRVMDFRPEGVHPEVAARARAVLDRYEMEGVQAVSPAAATFYAWTMGVVESVLSSTKDPVPPAGVKRQKELFGRPGPSPRRDYEFRFSTHKPKP